MDLGLAAPVLVTVGTQEQMNCTARWKWMHTHPNSVGLSWPGQGHSQHASANTPRPVLTGHPLLTKSGNTLLTEPSKDMADHYGDAELIYGGFRNRLPADVRDTVHAATKWCVFGPVSQPVSTQYVLQAVQERSRRLGGRVELLQFHWHDVSGDELCY